MVITTEYTDAMDVAVGEKMTLEIKSLHTKSGLYFSSGHITKFQYDRGEKVNRIVRIGDRFEVELEKEIVIVPDHEVQFYIRDKK